MQETNGAQSEPVEKNATDLLPSSCFTEKPPLSRGGEHPLAPCAHFFLAPSTLSTFFTILPSMTTTLPSRKAMRERPSQFLKVSTTSGCCGAKFTSHRTANHQSKADAQSDTQKNLSYHGSKITAIRTPRGNARKRTTENTHTSDEIPLANDPPSQN